MRFLRGDSISGFFALAAILIAASCSVFLWFIWALSHYSDFEAQALRERKAFVDAEKASVRAEVNGARERIMEHRSMVDTEEREAMRSRVGDALSIASGIFSSLPPSVSRREATAIVAQALRGVRFSQGRGYFFMFSASGVSILNDLRRELEGRHVLDLVDGEGNFPFREFLAKARGGGGYVSYSWPKPGEADGFFKKLSYVEYFAPGDFVVGTGEYVDEVRDHQMRESLALIEGVSFGSGGYVFALASDSTMLSHRAMPTLVGRRMVEEESPLLRELFPRMAEAVKGNGAGFIEYTWPKADGGLSTKVSYVVRVPGWDWILGAGFHLDDLEERIALGRGQLFHHVMVHLGKMALAIVAVVGVSLLVARRFARRIDRDLSSFQNFFAESALHTSRIHGPLRFTEFRSIAESANRMSEERERIEGEKKVLEERLVQKRNLETIGTLAGGIAHDFNNILSAVIGYAELLEHNADDPTKVAQQGRRIVAAGMRARDLVSRILAFSSQAKVEMHPVEVAPLVEESLSMVRASVPSTIEFSSSLAPNVIVNADPTQVSQLILNLLTNAATALHESGGRVSVSLSPEFVGGTRPPELGDLAPGAYALLTVADTGPGISREVMARIFEPFFTTHPGGKGSGLGLSVVHGVAKSHGGTVTVSSEPGHGASFSVYLPMTVEPAAPTAPTPALARVAGGSERLLFVDDESVLVELAVERLGLLGYKVTGFTDPVGALEAFKAQPQGFDMLITDMTMPKLTGDQLARHALSIRPDLPVIVSTGFSDAMNPQIAQKLGVAALLMKPVTLSAIASKVREILDGRTPT